MSSFIVKNIAPSNRKVKILGFSLDNGDTKNLLSLRYISEADVRRSLLNGELYRKITNNLIFIVQSDLDLSQFSLDQRIFLQQAGIIQSEQTIPSIRKKKNTLLHVEEDTLTGTQDDSNTIFTISSGKFLFNDDYKILVYRNGIRQKFGTNFLVAESGGLGTGYDTVIFIEPPLATDELVVDYYSA